MDLITMYPAQKDSPSTELTAPIGSSSTELQVLDSALLQGVAFPRLLTLNFDGGKGQTTETVIVTGRNGSALTIERGYSGDSYSWPAGTAIARVLTAQDVNDIQENIGTLAEGLEGLDVAEAPGIVRANITVSSNGSVILQPTNRSIISLQNGVTSIVLQLNDSAADPDYAQEFGFVVNPIPASLPSIAIAYISGATILFGDSWTGFEAGYYYEFSVIDGLAVVARFVGV